MDSKLGRPSGKKQNKTIFTKSIQKLPSCFILNHISHQNSHHFRWMAVAGAPTRTYSAAPCAPRPTPPPWPVQMAWWWHQEPKAMRKRGKAHCLGGQLVCFIFNFLWGPKTNFSCIFSVLIDFFKDYFFFNATWMFFFPLLVPLVCSQRPGGAGGRQLGRGRRLGTSSDARHVFFWKVKNIWMITVYNMLYVFCLLVFFCFFRGKKYCEPTEEVSFLIIVLSQIRLVCTCFDQEVQRGSSRFDLRTDVWVDWEESDEGLLGRFEVKVR